MGDEGPFSPDEIERLVRVLSAVDAELGIVVGGGNILRGARGGWLDRIDADEVGMLATVLNGLVLRDYLEKSGREATVQSAVATGFTAPIDPEKRGRHWRKGRSSSSLVERETHSSPPIPPPQSALSRSGPTSSSRRPTSRGCSPLIPGRGRMPASSRSSPTMSSWRTAMG